MEEDVIFITGLSYTGKVLTASILSEFGYNVTRLNDDIDDFLSNLSTKVGHRLFKMKINNLFIGNKNVIIIKHCGIFNLKIIYPNARIIVCMHNPVGYISDEENSEMEKLITYIHFYTEKLLEAADVVVRLEELIFNPNTVISRIINKLSIKNDLNSFNDAVNIVKEVVMINKYYQILCNICKNNHLTDLTDLLITMGYILLKDNKMYPIDYTNIFIDFNHLVSSKSLQEIIPTLKYEEREYNLLWRIFDPGVKLKIAICISGQPRFVDGPQYNLLKFHILDRYDCDIFCHYWWNNEETEYETSPWSNLGSVKAIKNTHEIIKKLYDPVAVEYDPVMEDNIAAEKYSDTSNIRTPYNLTSMYTSMKKVYKLLKSYVNSNGIDYDYVIRYRYDGMVDFFPNLYLLSSNNLYFTNLLPNDGLVSNN